MPHTKASPRRLHQIGGYATLALVIVGGLLNTGCGSGSDHQRPDIIFILADTLRADYLGCYGFQGDTAPTINALAEESVVFENAIAPAPWTKPSIASLFTSLDPLTHRVMDHENHFHRSWENWPNVPDDRSLRTDALAEEAWTLAEALKEQGYVTAAWVANKWVNSEWGFAQGFDHFDDFDHLERPVEITAGLMGASAQDWLREFRKGEEADKPYFLYLHFMDIHGPYQTTDELVEEFAQSPSIGDDKILTEHEIAQISYLGELVPWKDEERGRHLQNWRAAYAAGIRLFDDRLRPLLDWLRTSDRWDRTVVVFASDHGEELLDHGGWNHGNELYTHTTRTPLMIRLPRGAGGGRRDSTMASLLDLMPTLLSLAGQVQRPEALEGRVLLNIDGAEADPAPQWAFSGAVARGPRITSIQDQNYKLVWEFPNRAWGLFDLKSDPAESVNLVGKAEGEVELRMTEALTDRLDRLNEKETLLHSTIEMDPETTKRLKSLGYIQ